MDADEQTTEPLGEQPARSEDDSTAMRAEPEEQISAEQLLGYLRQAHFDGTRNRRGYHQGEVNALLVKLVEAVEEGQPLAAVVRRAKLGTVRLEHGYEIREVDEFLAAVVDLDPHAAVRPQVHRSALLTKLFG